MPSLTLNPRRPQGLPLLVAAALSIAVAGCGGNREGTDDLLREAEALAARGLMVEGAKLLAARVDSLPAPERGRVRAAMARLHHRGEIYLKAIEDAEAARSLGAAGVETEYIRADCLRRIERLGEAREALEKLVQAEPAYHRARFSLGALLARAADPGAALPHFDAYFAAASPSEPEYEEALEEHGRALRGAGKFRESADRFVALLEKDPLNGDLYSELALALYRQRLKREGRFVEEIWKLVSRTGFQEYVERGLERTGMTALALGQRAANRQRQRRFLEAFRSFRQAALIESEHPLLPLYLAELALRFRRFREAAAAAEKGIAEGRKPSSGLHWVAARARLEAGDAAGALAAAGRAAAEIGREGSVGVERGQASFLSVQIVRVRAALESGDLEGAAAAAATAEAAAPASWEPLYWRGRILLARGDAAGALPLFAEAARRGGEAADLRYWNGKALEAAGRVEEALASFAGAVQASPGHVDAHEALARLAPPAEKKAREEALAGWRETRDRVRRLEEELQTAPLEESGERYLELGKLYLKRKDPLAFDFFFLAADLLPRNAEPLLLLLGGMRQSQDIFIRLHLLRRLLEIDASDPGAHEEIASHYIKFQVRLDEAARLARRLHEMRPSAASYRLQGEAARLSGNRAEARAFLEEGVKAYPGEKALREALARIEGE
jgi:hypothetical protein